MEKLAVRPKVDLAFKKIFSENKNLLKSLLSASLDIPIAEIEELKLEDTEVLPQDINNKFCRLDLKVKTRGRVIDVEIQLNNQGNFQSRAMYYWARLFSQSLESGKDYNLLPETIIISFIDFELFGCREYHSKFVLKEIERNEILSNKIALHFFELKKLPREINKDKQIELWLKLIGAETYKELEELEELENLNDELHGALEYVKILNADEQFKRQVEMREQILIEETSALNFARQEGLEKGLEKGKEEERQKIIRAMKTSGLSEEQIEQILKIEL